VWKVEQALRWIFEDSTEIAKVSNSLVPDYKKRPERCVFIKALAETKAAIGLFQQISIDVISPVFIGFQVLSCVNQFHLLPSNATFNGM